MKTYHLPLISLCGADAFQLSLRNVAIPLRKLRTQYQQQQQSMHPTTRRAFSYQSSTR